MTYEDAVLMLAVIIGFSVIAASLITFTLAIYFTARDKWRQWRDTAWIYK